jgi:hypothetical protein
MLDERWWSVAGHVHVNLPLLGEFDRLFSSQRGSKKEIRRPRPVLAPYITSHLPPLRPNRRPAGLQAPSHAALTSPNISPPETCARPKHCTSPRQITLLNCSSPPSPQSSPSPGTPTAAEILHPSCRPHGSVLTHRPAPSRPLSPPFALPPHRTCASPQRRPVSPTMAPSASMLPARSHFRPRGILWPCPPMT